MGALCGAFFAAPEELLRVDYVRCGSFVPPPRSFRPASCLLFSEFPPLIGAGVAGPVALVTFSNHIEQLNLRGLRGPAWAGKKRINKHEPRSLGVTAARKHVFAIGMFGNF